MAVSDAFRGQYILVTGASSGIGAEFARQLAGHGAHLGLVARRKDRLDELAAELQKSGVRVAVAAADVSNREAMLEAIGAIRRSLGIEAFDRAILNAGVGITFRAKSFDSKRVEEVTRVNFLGAANAIEAVLPGMIARQRGHLVGISSLSARRGLPMGFAYGASKAALTTLLDGLRVETEPLGISVTAIHPGFVRTPMIADQTTPQPGLLEAPEAVKRMLRAIAREKRQYAFPFSTAFLTEALRRMPVWMSHRLLVRFVMPTIERSEQPDKA